MLAEKKPQLESAYKQLQLISQNDEKRLEYEAREKAIRDYNQMMYEARTAGLEQGRKESIQILISDYVEEGFSKEKILAKLERHFSLTPEQAECYFQQYAGER